MNSLITEPLGLFGWKQLEPVLLAALSTKMPLLLVGKHGCAKSFVLERLAESLNLSYRFYNASLINYDDLVGIPIPSKDNKSLEYISNNSSIWDAEVVFIDEINRTKPELQNKLFPIVYDKRIQGQDLTKLQYRWAAMNPSSNDEDDEIEYYGAMPLDPALADRFPFIVLVPDWNDLSEEDTRNILIDQFKGKHSFPIDIDLLIKETEQVYKQLINELQEQSIRYIQELVNLINNTYGYVSIRRATMLQSTLLAIHAARIVLNNHSDVKKEISFEDSCYVSINYTLPNNASKPISKEKLHAIVANAYAISKLDDSPEKRMLQMYDNEDKFIYMVKNQNDINPIMLSENILSTLSSFEEKKRRAIGLLGYLSFRRNSEILATTIETLINESKQCFEPKSENSMQHLKQTKLSEYVVELSQEKKDSKMLQYRNNLLNSYLPNGFIDKNEISELATFFEKMWNRIYG